MSTKELEFIVFCIENTAEQINRKGNEIFKLLTEDSGILDNYLVPCYETLHTQGKEYIVNDIVDLMKEKSLLP